MSYFAILTNAGLAALANAQATSTPLAITHVAVGDGNGAPITPGVAMTALVHETARVSVNAIDLDPENVDTVIIEGLLPVNTGGFTIREAGLFDAGGVLIAIASYPPIDKTVVADGASIAEYIRIPIVYSNVTTAVELLVDNSTIMATRLYVEARVAPGLYGDGSDGDLNFNGITNPVAGATLSGSVYTMTREIYAENLILGSGVTIKTNGFRAPFVRDTLTDNGGHITATAVQDGSGGGTTPAGTLIAGAGSGGAHGTGGAGEAVGASVTSSYGGSGGAGGSSDGVGKAGGTTTAPAAALGSAHIWSPQTLGYVFGLSSGTPTWTGLGGGAGGGGGDSNASGGGNSGYGGPGGGLLVVAARHLVLTAASVFQAAGGHGGNAAAGNNGGGGGGGGGTLILIYEDVNAGITFSAATNCPGGAHGNGSGTGGNGTDGSAGTLFEFVTVAA